MVIQNLISFRASHPWRFFSSIIKSSFIYTVYINFNGDFVRIYNYQNNNINIHTFISKVYSLYENGKTNMEIKREYEARTIEQLLSVSSANVPPLKMTFRLLEVYH